MATFTEVNAVQDGDGHWYIIPNEAVPRFYYDLETDTEDFDRWNEYRTNGDLNNIQLYAII